MNANNKLHQLRLEQWAARFRDQSASGLSVKDWCARNNFTIHNYYYWKRTLNLYNFNNSLHCNSIHISCRDFSIDLGTDVSSDVLVKVLKAVRHA